MESGARMTKSIVQKDERCFFCGRTTDLQTHHIFPAANRKWSDKYGLTIRVCPECHIGKDGVQYNRKKADSVKRLGQIAFEARHSHEEFMAIFGKNYI